MIDYERKNIPLARELRKNMTPWERKLWHRFLKDYPVRFQRQKAIDRFIVDFYCAKAQLVIELDGGGHYEPQARMADAERTSTLQSRGLKVLRFCNTDASKNFDGVCQAIDEAVRISLPQSPAATAPSSEGACNGRKSCEAPRPLRRELPAKRAEGENTLAASADAGARRRQISMKTITIYTDGACSGNPGPGGFGAILRYNGQEKELSGGEALTTNNRMELLGVITALEALKEPCQVELYSDSKYVVDALSKGWAEGWRKRGWIKSDKKPALNPDLWARLLELTAAHKVTCHWVKGHAENVYNNRCDALAVAQRDRYAAMK